jgi:DNA-binding NarL/FixJ family response regulator
MFQRGSQNGIVTSVMNSEEPFTILLADDHPVVRKGLGAVICEDPAFRIIGEESDGLKAWERIRELQPKVAVLDFTMPSLNGLEIARRVQEHVLKVAVVMLTMHKEEDLFNHSIDAGVLGYVLKENATDELLQCLRAVVEGQHYISPFLSHFFIRRRQQAHDFGRQEPGLARLTAAEKRILLMIAESRTSKQIAEILGISSRTVDNHRFRISEKLGLRGAHSLVKFAFDHRSELL